ncbi:hypothetical protein F5884DRAFT_856824 [Xylogone sp. PMI_703]|nr:hypothetical protein F5884DRAFT_856824 [Xylogone sp. PMI_703]
MTALLTGFMYSILSWNQITLAIKALLEMLSSLGIKTKEEYFYLIGWLIIPKLLTTVAPLIYKRIFLSAHIKTQRRHKLLLIIVFTIIYFLYGVWSVGQRRYKAESNFYEILHVPLGTTDSVLFKRSFRHMNKILHPDKSGSGSNTAYYKLQLAYATLSNPVKRIIYQKFGPEILESNFGNTGAKILEELPQAMIRQTSITWTIAIGIVGVLGGILFEQKLLVQLPLMLAYSIEISILAGLGPFSDVGIFLGLLQFQVIRIMKQVLLLLYLATIGIRFSLHRRKLTSQHQIAVKRIKNNLRIIENKRINVSVERLDEVSKGLDKLIEESIKS